MRKIKEKRIGGLARLFVLNLALTWAALAATGEAAAQDAGAFAALYARAIFPVVQSEPLGGSLAGMLLAFSVTLSAVLLGKIAVRALLPARAA